jgi:AbrB family looped-hinge helix DNA binding protein
MTAYSSRLSSKAQTVVPKEVRARLGIKPGDTLRYRITDVGVVIEKAPPGMEEDPFAAFTEWDSPEDDQAYADL